MTSDLLVERVEYEHHTGQMWRQPAPKHTRQRGEKYYSGVTVSIDKSDHHAELYGTLASGSTTSVRVDARRLHPDWKKISPQRAEQFDSELAGLIGHKVLVKSNGEDSIDYESLRKNLGL